MSVRLKDRLRPIPYGFKYLVAPTRWIPPPASTFDMVVHALQAHLKANPNVAKALGYESLDYDTLSAKVDEYNAAICHAHGWHEYIRDAYPSERADLLPKSMPRSQYPGVGAAVAGAETILEMFGAEGPIRDSTLSSHRASVCSQCPQNDLERSWSDYFTLPVSNILRAVLGHLKGLKLQTPLDDQLGVCRACECPMKLKVHARLEHILAHIDPKSKSDLWPECWITTEEHALVLDAPK